MKILVIEDQVSELKLAHDVLKSSGHSITFAGEANQAFVSICEERPDIILVDLSLPGMDGMTLVRKLKADTVTRGIHIVAITAYPELFTRDEVIGAGCDDYLVKPLNTRTIGRVLTSVVACGRAGP